MKAAIVLVVIIAVFLFWRDYHALKTELQEIPEKHLELEQRYRDLERRIEESRQQLEGRLEKAHEDAEQAARDADLDDIADYYNDRIGDGSGDSGAGMDGK